MAKGAATEAALAALHKKIAEVVSDQLGEKLCVNQEAVDTEGAEPEYMFTASPALLTVAARFVRDAGIAADLGSEEDQTSEVQRKLDALRQNRGKVVRLSDITQAAADG